LAAATMLWIKHAPGRLNVECTETRDGTRECACYFTRPSLTGRGATRREFRREVRRELALFLARLRRAERRAQQKRDDHRFESRHKWHSLKLSLVKGR